MKSPALTIGFAFVVGLALSLNMFGQQTRQRNSQPQTEQATFNSPAKNDSLKRVGFRLTIWKTIHSVNQNSAQDSIDTLKKIGCEVNSNNHGNHIDVQFRCEQWKTMEVPSDQLAAQWSSWLIEKGMETVIVDPPAASQKPTVKYRLVAPKSVHLHDPQQAKEIVDTLKMIGVEVSEHSHGDHIDANYHCPEWNTIELATDQNAHSWQTWLNNAGFETRHTH